MWDPASQAEVEAKAAKRSKSMAPRGASRGGKENMDEEEDLDEDDDFKKVDFHLATPFLPFKNLW